MDKNFGNQGNIGKLGYYKKSEDPIYNIKVENANRLISEYNLVVHTLPTGQQLKYQEDILRQCRELLVND